MRSYGSSAFHFLKTLHAISHSGAPTYIPTSSVRGSPISTPLQHLLFLAFSTFRTQLKVN